MVHATSQRSTASHSVPAMDRDTGRASESPVVWLEKTTVSKWVPMGRPFALALSSTATSTLSWACSNQLAGATVTQFAVAVAVKAMAVVLLFVTA